MTLVYRPLPYGGQESRRTTGRRFALVLTLALAAPVILGAGCTFDTLRSYAVRARLSQAVDSAALAGGRVMFDTQRDGHIRSFFDKAFPNGFLGAHAAPLTIAEDTAAGTLTVSGRASLNAMFLRLFGSADMTVEARSIVRRAVQHARKAQ
ncbi:pilus assembly protein TadG-related protein [Azospirillum doebereinerae]